MSDLKENLDWSEFYDVEFHQPKKGQIMARFAAYAELINGELKQKVVNLLIDTVGGGKAAMTFLKKEGKMSDREAVTLARTMAEDLISGYSREEVLEKPYKFLMEKFYYTQSELVPKSPYWGKIRLMNWEITGSSEILNKEGGLYQPEENRDCILSELV